MTWAKLSRKANKLQGELEAKQATRQEQFKASWKSKALYLMKFRFAVVLGAALAGLPSDAPVLTTSSSWLWPFASLFAYPAPAGSLSVLSWLLICYRLFNRVVS